jgi:hypothetical protein
MGFVARYIELRGFAAKVFHVVESDREKFSRLLRTRTRGTIWQEAIRRQLFPILTRPISPS